MGGARSSSGGGPPSSRRDVFDLIERVTQARGRELRVLTNGVLFQGAVLTGLREQDPERLHLQVSLDGATAATNDPVRGAGTYPRIRDGIRTLVEAGFAPTVSTVITRDNLGEMLEMVRLVKELGAAAWHLIWVHQKGRWADSKGSFPPPVELHEQLRRAQEEAARLGVLIDNVESYRQRVNGAPGSRVDLSNAPVSSLCAYSDGRVYPSAATVQYDALELGRWTGGNLERLLEASDVARRLRGLTVAEKPVCNVCKFRFLCGGGDLEHSYSYGLGQTAANGQGAFDHLDPYCDLYQGLITDNMFALAGEGRRAHRTDTGYNAPVIHHALGEGNLPCPPRGDLVASLPARPSHSPH